MKDTLFKSGLAPFMNSLIEMKRVQGFKVDKYEYTLKLFDTYCIDNNLNTFKALTQQNLNKWREEMINNKSVTIYMKYSVIRQLIRHINDLGHQVEDIRLPKNGTDSYIPYIFSKKQISQIFEAADKLRLAANDVNRVMFAIPAALRILYATGIRSGELVNIKNQDVDFCNGTITLCHTKNGQDRLIPLTRSALAVMVQYRNERQKLGLECTELPKSFFFVSAKGRGLNAHHSLYEWFRRILRACSIHHLGRRHGPRVHDLRHTFAVHSMLKQMENGVDLYATTAWLSTYLGHKSPYATEQYVRLASDALESVRNIQTSLATEIYPQLNLEENEFSW